MEVSKLAILPTAEPGPRNSAPFRASLVVAQFGVSIAVYPALTISLAARVRQVVPDTRAASLSMVLSIGALSALIGNPLVGALSDRTTARFGRRRPWLLVGALLTFGGLIVVGTGSTISVLTTGWAIVQLGANAIFAALTAMIPDRVPDHQRGRISGAMGVATSIAGVAGVILARQLLKHALLLFAAPGLICLISITPLLLVAKDDAIAGSDVLEPFRLGSFLVSIWTPLQRHRDFRWNFSCRFLVVSGLASETGFVFYYIIDRFRRSPQGAAAMGSVAASIMTVGLITAAVVAGWLSDRAKRRKIFVFTTATLTAAGLTVLAFAQSQPAFYIGIIILGIGTGAYMTVGTALAVAVLPTRADAAKDLGVLNIANTAPQSLIPIIAPMFLGIASSSHTNYTALFLFGASCAILGAFAVGRVRAVA